MSTNKSRVDSNSRRLQREERKKKQGKTGEDAATEEHLLE